jgi:hypothetical protein
MDDNFDFENELYLLENALLKAWEHEDNMRDLKEENFDAEYVAWCEKMERYDDAYIDEIYARLENK